jgi:Mycotoxin biosynthesis protein UstYa
VTLLLISDADHCLDMLRQTVMCQADTQVLTMKWRTDSRVPTANWTAPHRCLNWNQVEEWAANRRIASLMEPGYLYHPTLGPAYPDGRGNLIGETLPPEVV